MIAFKTIWFFLSLSGLIIIAKCDEEPATPETADEGAADLTDGVQADLKYTALLAITAEGDEPTPVLCNGAILSTKAILTSSLNFYKGDEAKKVTDLYVYAGMTSTEGAATWKDKCGEAAGATCQAKQWDETKGVIIDEEEPKDRKKNERLALIFLKEGFELNNAVGTVGVAIGKQVPSEMYECVFSSYTALNKLQQYEPSVAKEITECVKTADAETLADRICTEGKVGPCTVDIGGPLKCDDVVAGIFAGTHATDNRLVADPKTCSGGAERTSVYLSTGPYHSWINRQLMAHGAQGMLPASLLRQSDPSDETATGGPAPEGSGSKPDGSIDDPLAKSASATPAAALLTIASLALGKMIFA